MTPHNLPPELWALVFDYIDRETLNLYSSYLQDLDPAAIINSVRNSNLIVTHSWHSLLRLLPRAKRVRPLSALSRYNYVAFDEMHLVVAPPQNVIYVAACDNLNVDVRYETLMRFAHSLTWMLPLFQNACTEIYLFFKPLELNFASLVDTEILGSVCRGIASALHLWALKKIVIEGCITNDDWVPQPRHVYDFSAFSLTTLHLESLGISCLSAVKLPPTLKELGLKGNSIAKVGPLPDLEVLDLSMNKMTRADHFPGSLKVLKLSGNRIERLDLPPNLEVLDISFNRISLNHITFPPTLRELRVDLAQTLLMTKEVALALKQQRVFVLRAQLPSKVG